MNPWVPSYFFLAAIMDALTGNDPSSATDLPLEKLWCGLFQAPTPNPTPGLLMSGITECNYDGYARQAVAWFPTYIDVLGPQALISANMQFRATDATVPNVCTGIFVSDKSAGGDLMFSAYLINPLPLQVITQVLNTAVVFQLPFTAGTYGKGYVSA
jgi:hypothetical protein